jgi:hypothetical protein
MSDNDESQELKTPNGEEATETCPICDRPNNPGACDHCGHFWGACWDGDIIDSDGFDQFEKIWDQIVCSVSESDFILNNEELFLEKIAKLHPKYETIVKRALEGESATSMLLELVNFSQGPDIETDGMLSGSGYSLYLDERSSFEDALSLLHNVYQQINSNR